MTTALVLGKFAPLHRGHQLLIETALAENRQVLVMPYHAPDVTWPKPWTQAYQTQWMPEYGRTYWEAHQQARRLSLEQLVEIAEGHREREDHLAAEANRFLFIDTDASTTRVFAWYYHERALPRLDQLVEDSGRRYDLVFLCAADIPYQDTWDRSGAGQRQLFQARIQADLACRRIPYRILTGSVKQRIQQVRQVLSGFVKYQPLR
ncbi:ATP-binding protein [Rhabdochromatium marinum]|uniref:ATP/GTP-binding protein n=1 Tax=Rhabdochromatium marinum TaxID=48729 RepID=UPI001903CD93|nr:ATP-binding protein [Rhabdochromatium marinum]MBK1649323.1 hypothetical protein [Rhabdochromatium marinum]